MAAVAFLTRLPLPATFRFDAADVGRATPFFPLVGALLGGLQALAAFALAAQLPAPVVAVLVLALGVVLTGALHLDGLADTADGFGGGRDREDVLRIMRDHAIGAYGAVALILVLVAKVAALSALVAAGRSLAPLVIAAAAARWSAVALAHFLPYARREGGIGAVLESQTGHAELALATLFSAMIAVGLGGLRGAVCLVAVAALTAHHGWRCHRRIGGVTGDTLGANIELVEVLVLIVCLVQVR